MQDRHNENSPSSIALEQPSQQGGGGGKEPFCMSAILSQRRIVKRRRRSEDSGGSSSEQRSLSPMDLTSSKTPPSTSSGQQSPQEQSIKRRRLDDLLHRKFPSSSPSSGSTPVSSRKRKNVEEDSVVVGRAEEEEDVNIRAGRFIQIAALMNSEMFKNNPLLYYGYYAQLIQTLSRSHEEESGRKVNINNNGEEKTVPHAFRGYTSPEGQKKCSFNLSSLLSTPSSPSSANSSPVNSRPPTHSEVSPLFPEPSSPPASDEEPRHKRAPRALTGRYVRPGTGASPRTLALLRQKIQERLRLRGESLEVGGPVNHPLAIGRKQTKKAKKST